MWDRLSPLVVFPHPGCGLKESGNSVLRLAVDFRVDHPNFVDKPALEELAEVEELAWGGGILEAEGCGNFRGEQAVVVEDRLAPVVKVNGP